MLFEIVRPIEMDAKVVMGWRNDPVSLKSSFHKEPKRWPEFFEEFKGEYFAFAALSPLFIVEEGQRVGFLRFRPCLHPVDGRLKCCDISINIAPEWRGKGIGKKALKEIWPWLQKRGYSGILAEVKGDNKASKAAFEAAGYRYLSQIDKEGEKILRYFLTTDGQKVGKVFIIAEAGSNWRVGSPATDRVQARALIDAAVEAGADAVKFQTYRPETVYVPNAGQSDYLKKGGISEDIRTIFTHLAMPYELIEELHVYCQGKKIEFMSTPFSPADFSAVDPYVQRHKIASYEIGHIHLLELAAKSGKPLFLSTGASTEEEIAWAVDTYLKKGGVQLTLMQCTACYPASPSTLNLRAIPWLQKRFQLPVGLSDHSRHPTHAPVAAVALGAVAIEKHFTLDNKLPGPDHAFAITPPELTALVQAVRATEEMRGFPIKTIDPSEEELRSFARRGVQALRPIQKGERFKEGENIAILRPGKQPLGVHSKYLTELEGRPATRTLKEGEGVQVGDWQ